jgi:hypothetical protein
MKKSFMALAPGS